MTPPTDSDSIHPGSAQEDVLRGRGGQGPVLSPTWVQPKLRLRSDAVQRLTSCGRHKFLPLLLGPLMRGGGGDRSYHMFVFKNRETSKLSLLTAAF